MKKVPIKLHTSNTLQWLGKLYRNPADAIKEHVSNAIDEHLKAKRDGKSVSVCQVTFTLEKDKVIIEYPYGMSKDEFEHALHRVADSAKKSLDTKQIGQLGIGMFSFFQFGSKCVFFSKKDKGYETIKVTIQAGSDDADFETPKKRDKLSSPGIKIVISGLEFDPAKSRGPLSPTKLDKLFAAKFGKYLKDGSLKISIRCKGKEYIVKPIKIELPRVAEGFKDWCLSHDRQKKFFMELYFDPSGKGNLSIRHMGVTIIDDFSTASVYGLDESVYASGDIKGFIDADFLTPLPARTGFEVNADWINFLDELDKLYPSIETEIEELKQEEAEKKLTDIQKNAIKLAREILDTDEFKDLELLEGLGRKTREKQLPLNGFAFVPSSVRVQPGKIGTLSLKALVPNDVPDNSIVQLSLIESCVELKTPDTLVLKASEADEEGVVTIRISIEGKLINSKPVILTAKTDEKEAEANIRVAEPAERREVITGKEKEGQIINYLEMPFEDGPAKHSRYIARTIQTNELNADYKDAQVSEQTKLAYAVLMIGKETIAFNDKSEMVDEYLEKLLSFHFRLKNKLTVKSSSVVKRPRIRQKKNI